jgi:hypothetical protein
MKKIAPPRTRPPDRFPRPVRITDDDLDNPTIVTVLKLIWNTVAYLFHSPPGMIIGSAFVALMLWGQHGKVPLLGRIVKGWNPGGVHEPGLIIHGLPWDQEMISFLIGLLIVVVIPCLLIRFVYRQKLSDYGLGLPLPKRWRLTLLSSLLLLVVSALPFYIASRSPEMRAVYPLFQGEFRGTPDFLWYELAYLTFFVVIEFIFRGYLLFGLFHAADADAAPELHAPGVRGPMLFGYYAILLSMLSYTAWHLGKPTPELFSTLVWGLAAGTIALATGTIWPLILVHWLLNVGLDYLLWRHI